MSAKGKRERMIRALDQDERIGAVEIELQQQIIVK